MLQIVTSLKVTYINGEGLSGFKLGNFDNFLFIFLN